MTTLFKTELIPMVPRLEWVGKCRFHFPRGIDTDFM